MVVNAIHFTLLSESKARPILCNGCHRLILVTAGYTPGLVFVVKDLAFSLVTVASDSAFLDKHSRYIVRSLEMVRCFGYTRWNVKIATRAQPGQACECPVENAGALSFDAFL